MSKNKLPTLREIEASFDQWRPMGAKRRIQVELRNEFLREPKIRKEAKFTARLSKVDFDGLKRLACENAIPYQTLLGHVIHLYVTGQLVNVREIRRALFGER